MREESADHPIKEIKENLSAEFHNQVPSAVSQVLASVAGVTGPRSGRQELCHEGHGPDMTQQYTTQQPGTSAIMVLRAVRAKRY